MNIKRFFLFLFILFFLIPTYSSAEQFKLKTGEILKGTLKNYSNQVVKIIDLKGNLIKIPKKNISAIIFEEEKIPTAISQIKAQKDKLKETKVTVFGNYFGWSGSEGLQGPPVTRSDWILKDGTGAIYITGINPNLDPIKDKGQPLIVTGILAVTDKGEVYIKAETINCFNNKIKSN